METVFPVFQDTLSRMEDAPFNFPIKDVGASKTVFVWSAPLDTISHLTESVSKLMISVRALILFRWNASNAILEMLSIARASVRKLSNKLETPTADSFRMEDASNAPLILTSMQREIA